jgi:hypothetical protein
MFYAQRNRLEKTEKPGSPIFRQRDRETQHQRRHARRNPFSVTNVLTDAGFEVARADSESLIFEAVAKDSFCLTRSLHQEMGVLQVCTSFAGSCGGAAGVRPEDIYPARVWHERRDECLNQ